MQETILKSSALTRIIYDAVAQRLQVEFRDRTICEYDHLPPEVHSALLTSESKGRFFNQAIRNHFCCIQRRPPIQPD